MFDVLIAMLLLVAASAIGYFFAGSLRRKKERSVPRVQPAERARHQPVFEPASKDETPHVKDLLHLTHLDSIPLAFRFAGRTFVRQPGSPPSYLVCSTEEDQDEIRKEVLAHRF